MRARGEKWAVGHAAHRAQRHLTLASASTPPHFYASQMIDQYHNFCRSRFTGTLTHVRWVRLNFKKPPFQPQRNQDL